MSRISVLALTASLISVAGACGGEWSSGPSPSGPRQGVVTDTLGKVFSVSCTSSLFCSLTPQDSTLKPMSCAGSGTDGFVLFWGGQILAVHAVAVPASGSVSLHVNEPARPVACASDADCLPELLAGRYACQSGLCQHHDFMLTIDVAALCQADIPWPTSCPYDANPLVAARMAEVESLCGPPTECSNVPAVPAVCRQPTAEGLCPTGPAPAGATCSPPCAATEECVGGACVPLSSRGGMTCTTPDSCPSDARCCDGSDATCDGVRLPAADGIAPGQLEVSPDGLTVTDTITGLVWQRDTGGRVSGWGAANTYCASLSLGGASGWRLPTPMELITIVDFTKAEPAIDRRAFPETFARWFWTSVAYEDSGSVRVVDFNDAGRAGYDTSGSSAVRCVR